MEDQQRVIDALPTDEPPTAVSLSRLSSDEDLGIHGLGDRYPDFSSQLEPAPLTAGAAVLASAAAKAAPRHNTRGAADPSAMHPYFAQYEVPGSRRAPAQLRSSCGMARRRRPHQGSTRQRRDGACPARSASVRAGPSDDSDSSDSDGDHDPLALRETAGVAG